LRNSPKFSAAWLASLTPELQKNFLQGLTNDQLTILLSEWSFWARDDQLPPEGNWTTWLLLGGRGAGKTRAGAEWIRMRVKDKNPMFAARHIALVGETLAAARSVMVEGPSGILSISPEHERPQFISSRNMLVWPNGAKAQLFSSTRPASLRGPQFDAAWCDELSKWQNDQMTWDMLQFGLRLGPRPRQAVTTTPRRTKLLISLLEDKNCIVSRARTVDNKANLAPSFLSEIVDRYKGSRLGRQELDAEMIDLEQSGLWSHALIDRQRCYD
jgi:phage terminase large subunit-like protein